MSSQVCNGGGKLSEWNCLIDRPVYLAGPKLFSWKAEVLIEDLNVGGGEAGHGVGRGEKDKQRIRPPPSSSSLSSRSSTKSYLTSGSRNRQDASAQDPCLYAHMTQMHIGEIDPWQCCRRKSPPPKSKLLYRKWLTEVETRRRRIVHRMP